jgi:hypothetical protein
LFQRGWLNFSDATSHHKVIYSTISRCWLLIYSEMNSWLPRACG